MYELATLLNLTNKEVAKLKRETDEKLMPALRELHQKKPPIEGHASVAQVPFRTGNGSREWGTFAKLTFAYGVVPPTGQEKIWLTEAQVLSEDEFLDFINAMKKGGDSVFFPDSGFSE